MKCNKVKNPCKICFQHVSNKNGLQCKGACKKWAHYKCLNYTPGKISDIKAGIIKVTCPCPDCTTSEPKELLTNPPYTCTDQGCPATKLPSCESADCPSKQKPIPQFEPPILTPPKQEYKKPHKSPPRTQIISKRSTSAICPTPPRKTSLPKVPVSPQCKPASPLRKPVSPPRRTASPPRKSDSPQKRQACPSCPLHCPKKRLENTVGYKSCSPQSSQSCSIISTKSTDSGKSCFRGPRSSSCSGLSSDRDQKMLFNTIEQMCDTVGQLSKQLKDLMCKVIYALDNRKQ